MANSREEEEFEFRLRAEQEAQANASQPSLKEFIVKKLGASMPKSPTDLLPPIPTSMPQIPGASTITQGAKVIADNPEGAMKALPAIAGTAASIPALPAIPSMLAVGGATAAGAFARDKYLGKPTEEASMNALKEGAGGALWQGVPIAVSAAKPLVKEFGLSAVDTLAQVPQGSAKTAYSNTKVLTKGLADKYVPQIKKAAQGLSRLAKRAADTVKGAYGEAVAKVTSTREGQKAVRAVALDDALNKLADGVGLGKSGVQPGSDAVRTEVKKLLQEFTEDASTTVKKKVIEKGPLGESIRRTVESKEMVGAYPLEKALNLRKRLGEMADWAAATPGNGRQAASIREAYGEITGYIHRKHPEIAKVDAQYKKLIEASSYIRQKLGIKPGEEATQESLEKIEQFVRTINNPAKKETLQEAVDVMAKELGQKRSVVKKAAEINASKEFGSLFPTRKSINITGKAGKMLDIALMPITGPRAMANVIRGTKRFSTAAGNVPGKRQMATATGLAARYANKD